VPESVVIAIGCGVLWLAAALWARFRSPRTLPSEGGGPVPEPVRVLMRPGTNRDDPSTLNAAILELAEAGVLSIVPADSQHPAMVEPGALPHASQLPDYQASVVARLLHRRGTTVAPVPLTALQPGEDPAATKWHREFYRQVQRAAADNGLLQPTLGATRIVLLALSSLVVSVLAANALSRSWHGRSGFTDLQFVLFEVVAVALLVWASRIRPTAAGRALIAAGATPVAQAVAPAPIPNPGPNPVPANGRPDSTLVMRPVPDPGPMPGAPPQPAPSIKILPNQLEPLPKHQIWSSYGGSWHPLDTRTKEVYAVRTGVPGVFILVLFGILSVVGAFVSKHNSDPTTGSLTFGLFAALPILLLVGILLSGLSRWRLPKRAVLRGQVAKLWEVKQSGEGGSSDVKYYCSLDVGRAPASVRLQVGAGLYRRMPVGTEVEVLVNPRRRSIKDVRFVGEQ
jgi:hypothetical protein